MTVTFSLYQRDPSPVLRRGAIFQYCPIFWLEPPLWILRDCRMGTVPRTAHLYKLDELQDAFRIAAEENQEDVVARAKVRYIVILSPDREIRQPKFKELLVAPTYTVDHQAHKPEFISQLRAGRYPELFYLPSDPAFPEIAESYVDLRKVQSLDKQFLSKGPLLVRLSEPGTKALVQRYRDYLAL